MTYSAAENGAYAGLVGALARRFPSAGRMRLPVRLHGVDGRGRAFSEHTVVEYGTDAEWMFVSALPLGAGDRVRLVSEEHSLDLAASVVAVHSQNGRSAIAVRIAPPAPQPLFLRPLLESR